MTVIFISHSSKAGPQADAFLESVPARLAERGLEPFLDTTGLRAGHEWRPVLYRKLAECQGAVLVLGPEALGRPWVRQEAEILLWRRAIQSYAGRAMPVVAVLLDGLTRTALTEAFPAINIGELELVRPASETVDAARVVAGDVARAFPEGAGSDEDPMQWWTARVGSWLTDVDDFFLDRVGTMLSIAKEDWDREARCQTLADTLLHSHDFDLVEAVLEEILESGAGRAAQVINAVLPVAVSAQTAQVLLTAMSQGPGDRVAALNTWYPELAELFVQRATCCDRSVLVVRTPLQVTGEADDLYAEVVAAMGAKAGVRPPQTFRPELVPRVKKNLVVVLRRVDADGQGLPIPVLEAVMTRLRSDFPSYVFLVLPGPRYTDDLDALVPSRLRAAPPLDEEEQDVRYFAVNRLRESLRPTVSS